MTDVDRAATAAGAAADEFNRAKLSLENALRGVDDLEGRLYEAFGDAHKLIQQGVGLATDTQLAEAEDRLARLTREQPAQPSYEQIAALREAENDRTDRLGYLLNGIRTLAEELNEKLLRAQRTVYGPDGYDVPDVAMPGLDTGSVALTTTDNALAGLRDVPGHDDRTADTLQERVSLLHNAVDQSRDILKSVSDKLDDARDSLTRLSRTDYLSTDQSVAELLAKITATASSVSTDVGLAQREMGRTEGRLDIVQKPAADAARDSVRLAVAKGFNPPVAEERRTNAGSAQGAAAGGAGRDRDKGAVHGVD